jgi:colicin import membrane protein
LVGKAGEEETRRQTKERETRYREIEERIGSVSEKAKSAQAHAAAVEIRIPEVLDPEEPVAEQKPVVEQEPVVEDAGEPATKEAEAQPAAAERTTFKGTTRRRFRLLPRRKRSEPEPTEQATEVVEPAKREKEAKKKAEREKAEKKKAEKKKAEQARKAKAAKARKEAKERRTTKRGSATKTKAGSGAGSANAATGRRSQPLNVNKATFEQLRERGMSVTQATRVIAYRERQHGFDSLDDLDAIPGFPKTFLGDLKDELTT